jgi:hypothetical protein
VLRTGRPRLLSGEKQAGFQGKTGPAQQAAGLHFFSENGKTLSTLKIFQPCSPGKGARVKLDISFIFKDLNRPQIKSAEKQDVAKILHCILSKCLYSLIFVRKEGC